MSSSFKDISNNYNHNHNNNNNNKLYAVAKRVLLGNIVEIETVIGTQRKKRQYLLAGNGYNRAIFVRDVCLSSRALMMAGLVSPLFNLVELYIENLDSNITPIEVFDDYSPLWRQTRRFATRYFGTTPLLKPPESPRPHASTSAFVNHLLVIFAATHLPQPQRDDIFNRYATTINAMLRWYTSYIHDGLIWQPKFFNWRTYTMSAEGYYFFTNLLLYEVQSRLISSLPPIVDPTLLRSRLREFHSPLFVDRLGSTSIRLEDNLFAILWSLKRGGIFETRHDTVEHYIKLSESPLWTGCIGITRYDNSRTDCLCCIDRHPAAETTGFPGFASWKSDPDAAAATLCTHFCGTQSIDDGGCWSWLIAFAREIEYLITLNQGAPLPRAMYSHADRGKIEEIMRHREDLTPFRTCLFSGNSKNTLGAAYVYEYLKTLRGDGRRKNEYV